MTSSSAYVHLVHLMLMITCACQHSTCPIGAKLALLHINSTRGAYQIGSHLEWEWPLLDVSPAQRQPGGHLAPVLHGDAPRLPPDLAS